MLAAMSLLAIAQPPVPHPEWTLGPWAIEHLPSALLKTGPWGVAVWQWMALVLLLALAVVLGMLLGSVAHAVLLRIARRVWRATQLDDLILAESRNPLRFAWMLTILGVCAPFIGFGPVGQGRIGQLLGVGLLLLIFDLLRRLVDVAATRLLQRPWAASRFSGRTLIPLAQRVLKGGIVVLAVLAVLNEFGYPVSTMLAGLGIGGIALALAAQKTVENLFGAFSIAADQPFQVGDFVRVANEAEGTVEHIGLRSTRLRTADRTLVTLPNGQLAEKRLETFAARDRFLVSFQVRVVYGTTSDQLRTIISGIEARLQQEPSFHAQGSFARLGNLGASSLDIDVTAFFKADDFDHLRNLRQDLLLDILGIVEGAGTSLAYPTQTIRLAGAAGEPSPASERTG